MGASRPLVILAAFAAIVLFVAVAGTIWSGDPATATQRSSQQTPSGPPLPPSKGSKIASSIVQLMNAGENLTAGVSATADSISRSNPGMEGYFKADMLRLDPLGRLQVYIAVSATDADILGELESFGVVVERLDESGSMVQAVVPLRALSQVAGLEYVSAITPS